MTKHLLYEISIKPLRIPQSNPTMKRLVSLFFFFLFSIPYSNAQIMNTQIEAILDIHHQNDLLHITGIAQSKTDLTASISYKLSIIKTNIQTNNQSKSDQGGRKVVEAFQRVSLSTTSINTTTEDRLIVLLLIYDATEKLIGHARYVFNEDRDDTSIKENLANQFETQTKEVVKPETIPYEKINFKGIVVDETKTKAGRDFYQLYYSNYLSSSINSEYIITISEAITFGNNTKITIKANDYLIFEFFIRTQYDYLKTMSQTALTMTVRYLEHIKTTNQRTKTF